MKISDAELAVMQILWNKEKATSFDIIDALKGVESWNESTIRTLITRLHDKKAIEIVEKIGKTYTYAPILKEEEYKAQASKNLLEKLYNGSVNNMLLNFVKHDEISKKDLEELLELIEGEERTT